MAPSSLLDVAQSPKSSTAATLHCLAAKRPRSPMGATTQSVTISQGDMENAIVALRKLLVDQRGSVEDAYKAIDADGDGMVSVIEFVAFCQSTCQNLCLVIGAVPLDEIFSTLDLDGSDSLSMEELFLLDPRQSEDNEFAAVEQLRKALLTKYKSKAGILKGLDLNCDGEITFEDLDSAFRSNGISVKQATGGIPLRRIFDLLDSDCTQRLTWDTLLEVDARQAVCERRNIISSFREGLLNAFGSQEKCIEFIDTSHNGFVSFTELRSGIERKKLDTTQLMGDTEKDFRWLFRILDYTNAGELTDMQLFESDPRVELSKLLADKRRNAKTQRLEGFNSPKVALTPTHLKKAHKDMAFDFNKLKADYRKLEEDYDSLMCNNLKMTSDFTDLQKSYEEVQQELFALRKTDGESDDRESEFRSERSNRSLFKQIEAQEEKCHALDERVRLAHEEVLECKRLLILQEIRYDRLDREHNQTLDEYAKYKRDQEREEASRKQLHTRNHLYSRQLQESCAKLSKAENTLYEAQKKVEEEKVFNKELQERCTEIINERMSLKNSHELLKQELAELQEKHRQLRSGLKDDWETGVRSLVSSETTPFLPVVQVRQKPPTPFIPQIRARNQTPTTRCEVSFPERAPRLRLRNHPEWELARGQPGLQALASLKRSACAESGILCSEVWPDTNFFEERPSTSPCGLLEWSAKVEWSTKMRTFASAITIGSTKQKRSYNQRLSRRPTPMDSDVDIPYRDVSLRSGNELGVNSRLATIKGQVRYFDEMSKKRPEIRIR